MKTTTPTRFVTPPDVIAWAEVPTPLGRFLLAGMDATLVAVRLPGGWQRSELPRAWSRDDDALSTASAQLDAYFDGTLERFDLDFAPSGTPFQLAVWGALCDIPYGKTASYRDVATSIGNRKATRAVGLANNRNPIALCIPCHRVIGANGSLTGYGGGLEMKRWLLDHERSVLARSA